MLRAPETIRGVSFNVSAACLAGASPFCGLRGGQGLKTEAHPTACGGFFKGPP